MKQLTLQAKVFIILVVVGISGLVFFSWPAFGDTVVNLTLQRDSLDQDLAAHYTMDGKDTFTNIADRSGSGNDGSLILGSSGNTSTTTDSGAIGQGLSLDGVDDYVNTHFTPTYSTTDDFSISVWFKPENSNRTADEELVAVYAAPERIILNIEGNASLCNQNDIVVEIADTNSNQDTLCASFANVTSWFHVVLSYDADGDVVVYVDGDVGDSDPVDSASGVKDFSSRPPYLGIRNNDGSPNTDWFTGSMDDVRFYDRALSAKDVQRLFNLGATTKINTTLDRSNTSIESSLIGHWTFDGSDMLTNVADTSGQGNDGSLILGASGNTSTTTAAGRIGQALEFDGAGDYVDVGDAFNATGAMTASAWVKADDLSGGFELVLSKGRTHSSAGDSEQGPFFLGTDGGDAIFNITNSSDNRSQLLGVTSLSTGVWYHIVGVWDGTTNADNMKIYLNGEVDNTSSQTTVSSMKTNNKSLEIGRDQDRAADDRFWWDGLIDDVRVYTRALSDEEIKRLYNLGATTKINTTLDRRGTQSESGLVGHWTFDGPDMFTNVADTSGQGNDGKLQGQTSTTTLAGAIGQALEFDGVDDTVEVSNESNFDFERTDPFSLSVWVNPDALLTGTDEDALISKIFDSGTPDGYALQLSATGETANYMRFVLSNDFGAGDRLFTTTNYSVPADTWTHLVVTYDGSSSVSGVTNYANGIERSKDAGKQDDSLSSTVLNDILPTLGSREDIEKYFDGEMDDVRVYSRELSADEVERLYQMGR